MHWMAQSVLSDMMPPWVFSWTHLGPYLWHCHILLQAASHLLKKKEQCLMGFTFQLHWEWAWPTNIGGKKLCTPVAMSRQCSGKNVSLYTLCGSLLFCNWWSFLLNHLDKDECNTVWKWCCMVQQNKCYLWWNVLFLGKNQMVKPWYLLGINLC